MCASKTFVEDSVCKCCGETGHSKKDCPKNGEDCSRCGVRGHLQKISHHPAGHKKKAAKQTQQPHKTAGQARVVEKDTPEAFLTSWICTPCGALVVDEDATATRCPNPKCREPKDHADEPDKTTSGVMPLLKKASASFLDRVKTADQEGTAIPLSKEMQEAHEERTQLEKDIALPKQVKGFDEQAQAKQKELTKVKNRIPMSSRGVQEDAQALEILKEVEEKK